MARPRPACTPLDERVGELIRLADAAHEDPVRASAVLNQAALLASDVGLPELARAWCHQHARAVCVRLPGDAKTAIHGLEPVVNLARLRIRDGDGDNALRLLEALFEGVSARIDTEVDQGLVVPCSQLTTTEDDHHEVVRWVWTVLLADGTHAMTTAGRWTDALNRLHGRAQALAPGEHRLQRVHRRGRSSPISSSWARWSAQKEISSRSTAERMGDMAKEAEESDVLAG